MKHAPGNLRYDKDSMLIFEGDQYDWTVAEIRGWSYLRSPAVGLSDKEAIAAMDDIGNRLATCWNAMDGIADPAALRRERDELLAALKGLLKESQWFTSERQGQYGESYRPTDGEAEAQAAILKAEGGAA